MTLAIWVMSQTNSTSLGRVLSIDGLRGLAALAVLIYHARSMFWIGTKETYQTFGLNFDVHAWAGYVTFPFNFGSLGVVLFFVLSGYCIHRRGARQIAADPAATIHYGKFFSRRFWRLYPTYVAALLLTALIDWWVQSQTGTVPPGQDHSIYALIVSLFAMQGYLAQYFGSNGVFWTLAMEIHLYLAYPLLFFISRKYGPNRVMVLTLVAGLLYFAVDALWGIESRLPYRRIEGPVFLPFWFTWATGFYLAEIEAKRVRDFKESTWAMLMVTGFVVGLGLYVAGHTTYANMPWALFFVGLLRLSMKERGERTWSLPPGRALAFVGVFSYSLYAIHAPVLHALHVLIDPVNQAKFATIWPALGVSILSIPIAWIFFRTVEYWSIRPKN